jgi:hypothetical protein
MPGPRRGCSTIDEWVDTVILMKGPKCFVSILRNVVLTEECNVVVSIEDLIGAIEYVLQ